MPAVNTAASTTYTVNVKKFDKKGKPKVKAFFDITYTSIRAPVQIDLGPEARTNDEKARPDPNAKSPGIIDSVKSFLGMSSRAADDRYCPHFGPFLGHHSFEID